MDNTYYDLNMAAEGLCNQLLNGAGQKVSTPRTGEFLEIRNAIYTIQKPLFRDIAFPLVRPVKLWKFNEMMTEFLSLNPPLTEKYVQDESTRKLMASFHRGDGRHNYTYGERWHNNMVFQKIIQRLQADRYSRQAVMNIWNSALDLSSTETNVPCTIVHQFLIRRDEQSGVDALNMTVFMRSQDFFKGWKYDTFFNSFLHEAFAGWLGVEVGMLTMFIGSFHVYRNDYQKLVELGKEIAESNYIQPNAGSIPSAMGLSFEEFYRQLWYVKKIEEITYYKHDVDKEELKEIHQLHPKLIEIAMMYVNHNMKGGK